QRHLVARQGHQSPPKIHSELAGAENGLHCCSNSRCCRALPQGHPDAREEFLYVKWLANIVGSAQLKESRALIGVVALCQQQDWRASELRHARYQAFQLTTRTGDIQQHEVWLLQLDQA